MVNIDMDDECLSGLFGSLQGQVLHLALDPRGCRIVQRALELADHPWQVCLVQELQGHVREALESPHANHVLQRAIELMRPISLQFMLKELQSWGRPASLARHRYGCRILERLIEHFPPDWLAPMVNEVLKDSQDLCRHVYGNFVMQHLLEHGERNHRRQIVDMILVDVTTTAASQHGCGVLDKALSYASQEDQQRLARRVLEEDGLLAMMANLRGGFAATQRLFKVADGQQLEEAREQIRRCATDIARSKHGRALVSMLLPELVPLIQGCANAIRDARQGIQ
eukprot:TRINITY_DN88301_c0_g1_i1.p1 TRINITY_DN88301_c0_g1~~TRINITY_DN88301_c0_g1_i1.p1  ORF type:complete len:290 (-),score=43.66 TRINITY_DN88301_c0_g1_i1:569-1417(-)